MKMKMRIEGIQQCWSLVTNITFSTVPSWYDTTYRDLKCSVCMPKVREKGKKYPLMIWICGGAFKVMDKDVWLPQWVELAKHGCVVAGVEYRTSNEAVFPAALSDVKTAIRYMKAHAERFGVDPNRIFVAGESAGGTLACLAGVTGSKTAGKYDAEEWGEYDSSVRGVIDFYGLVDATTHVDVVQSNMTFGSMEAFLGIECNVEERKREMSVVNHLSEEVPPFLIFHGEEDELVSIKQSDMLYDRLTQLGVRADYYILEKEGHGADAFYQSEIMDIVWKFIESL